MANTGPSMTGQFSSSQIDDPQHASASVPNDSLRNSPDKPPRTPQKEWLRATPPPRTLLVTPRQRPHMSDSSPEQADSPVRTQADNLRNRALDDQENDRRLAHQSASTSCYSSYQQRAYEGHNSFLRGSWQPNASPSFQPSPNRRDSSRVAAPAASPLMSYGGSGATYSNSGATNSNSAATYSNSIATYSHSGSAYGNSEAPQSTSSIGYGNGSLQPLVSPGTRYGDKPSSQGVSSHLGGMQTPLSPGWGKASGAGTPRSLIPESVDKGPESPSGSRQIAVHSAPAAAKSMKRVETTMQAQSAVGASSSDMLFNRFAPPWLKDSSLVHEKVVVGGRKGRRESRYAAVTNKELVLVTIAKRGTIVREMVNVLDIVSIDHFKDKPLPPLHQSLCRRLLHPFALHCICHVSVAPIDEDAEHDEHHAAGLALNLGPENKALELFTGSGSRLQFVLASVCYNALVDQSRAGEVHVGGPEEHHDEATMKALFSELKSELLVAHSIPDKLKLFEEIGSAGEHSTPIKKLFFESGVFSRLLDETRLTKLKQKVMVELHSGEGTHAQNTATGGKPSPQKSSGNKIREPGTPKQFGQATPEPITPRRTILGIRNSMSTPLGGRISGDSTPSTPRLEGVYRYGQGPQPVRGPNVYGSGAPWKEGDRRSSDLDGSVTGRGGESGGRTLRAPSVRECAAAVEGLQYVVTLLACLTSMLCKSEAIAARQSLLTPPRHYSFHSMLATLMEDFPTPPGLQGAQRQLARQLAKQILDLQAGVLFHLLSISDQAALGNSKYSRDYLLYYVIRVPGFNERKLSLLFRRLVELLYSERSAATGVFKAGAAAMISIYQHATLLTWICERSSSARSTLTATCSEDIKYRLGNPQIFGQLDLRYRINERSRDLVNWLLKALTGGGTERT